MAAARFTLGKNERLKSQKLLEKVIVSKKAYATGIKCFYLFNPDPELLSTSVAAFTVPKRIFKRAVDRNFLKRRMKEAFRLEKPAFDEKLRQLGTQCAIIFVYTGKEKISFRTFQEVIKQLISRILKDGPKPE